MADENANEASGGGTSFIKVALIALLICVALVGGAVYFLSGSSQLPFNYQGFDK